ncbi:MAG: hypothetical protein VB031_01990 [Eubacteriaceae bacterium]|nr:hypothetical protein [Eubacteriaceae bacterium]
MLNYCSITTAAGKANFSVRANTIDTAYSKGIYIFANNESYEMRALSSSSLTTGHIKIPYSKSTTIKVVPIIQVYGNTASYDIQASDQAFTQTVSSPKPAKPTIYVTKLSKSTVGIGWNGVEDATGYKIYRGSKLVKTVGSKTRHFTYKKKKAYKYKYTVCAYVKEGSATAYGTKAKSKKPASNYAKFGGSIGIDNHSYMTCDYVVKKITASGNTYYVTGYAVNNRIFKAKKYKKLKITIYCNGKKVAKKTYRNKKINVKPERAKKIKLKIKGKSNQDLKYYNVRISVSEKTVW